MPNPHNLDNKLQGTYNKLQASNLSDYNKDIIDHWKVHLESKGLSNDRISRYLSSINTLTQYIDFKLDKADKQRLKKVAGRINQGRIERQDNRSDEYSPCTLAEFKKAIKSLYQFIEEEEDPEIIDFLSVHVKSGDKPRTDPEELLTPEQVRQIAIHASNKRNAALIMTLWDTGGRISEILNLKWKHITFDGEIPSLRITESKTMQRTVYIKECVDALREWREAQQLDGSDNYVFTKVQAHQTGDLSQQMSYNSARHGIVRAAEAANIPESKRYNPHGFRKARATHLARQGFNAAQLCKQFGWLDFSRAREYVRMAKSGLKDAMKQMQGIDTKEMDEPDKLEQIPCRQCDTVNGAHRSTCSGCGTNLSPNKDRMMQGMEDDLTEQVHDTLVDKLLDGEISNEDLNEEARKVAKEKITSHMA